MHFMIRVVIPRLVNYGRIWLIYCCYLCSPYALLAFDNTYLHTNDMFAFNTGDLCKASVMVSWTWQ